MFWPTKEKLSFCGQHQGDRAQLFLRIVAIICPTLLISYSAWSFFPALRERIPTLMANLGVGVPVVVLSAAAWIAWDSIGAAAAARTQARIHAYQEAAEHDAALLDKMKVLPDDSPLTAFLPYIEKQTSAQGDLRGATLQRMRKLPHRQSEAEVLLNQQDTRVLRILSDLDLKTTPVLCEGARKSLQKAAAELKPATSTTAFQEEILNPYTTNIGWLLNNKCDCAAEVEAIEQTLLLYPDSFDRKRAIDWLDYLVGKPNPYGKKQ